MVDQELILDFLNRFCVIKSFNEDMVTNYSVIVGRHISVYCDLKFNYTNLMTSKQYISSYDIRNYLTNHINKIKNYGFLQDEMWIHKSITFISDDEKKWNKEVLEKKIKPRIREIGKGMIHGISLKRNEKSGELIPTMKISFKRRVYFESSRYLIINNIRQLLIDEFNLNPNITVTY
jgi:hypothetical protein